MPAPAPILLPDAGPLITLAHADRLDLLLRPGWPLRLVDMVLHELTRNATPTRDAITAFVARKLDGHGSANGTILREIVGDPGRWGKNPRVQTSTVKH